jgi:large subunit ribosomal protein L9
VKPTEISKIIFDKDKIEIKPSMIQLIDDIKSLGDFKVKINLHSEVQIEIKIKVIAADTIQ